MTSASIGGFQVKRIELIEERYKCVFCGWIIRSAVQLTGCGHRACQLCLNSYVSNLNRNSINCPNGECEDLTEVNKIRLDKAFQRELDLFKVECYHDDSCSWTGMLKDYQYHLDTVHNIFRCKYCQENFQTKSDAEAHENTNCPKIFLPCSISSCVTTMVRQDNPLVHFLSSEHQEKIISILRNEHDNLSSIIELIERHDLLEEQQIQMKFEKELQELLNQIENVIPICQSVENEQKELKNFIEEIINELRDLSTKIVEQLTVLGETRGKQMSLQHEIDNIVIQFDACQPNAMNGQLLWRVENVSKLLIEAQSERRPWIVSPDFYSSPFGYRMRVRLFPYGDGQAKRSHMSLFFMLVKGEYDAVLQWPFPFRINFCLLDQTGTNHIIDSFLPDVKSASFQRPRTEANIPNGIPKFASLSSIQQDGSVYVRDDTMYLKILVDFTCELQATPISLLTADPATPLHVQENLGQRSNLQQGKPLDQLMNVES